MASSFGKRINWTLLLWMTFLVSGGKLKGTHDFCDTPEQFPHEIHTIGRTRGHRVLLITRDMTVMKVPMRHRGHAFQFLWARASSKPLEKIWPRLSGDVDYVKIKEGTTNLRHSLVRTNTRHRADSSLFFVVSSVDLNLTSLGYNIRTRKVFHQSWNYGHQKWLLDANVFWISDRRRMLMTVTEVSPYNYKYNWVWIDQLSRKGGYLMRNNSPLSQLCFDATKSRIIFSYYACTSAWPEALKRGFISGKWVYLLGEKTVFIFQKKHMPRNQYRIQRSVYAYRVNYANFLNCTITSTSLTKLGAIFGIVAFILALIVLLLLALYWFYYRVKPEESAVTVATFDNGDGNVAMYMITSKQFSAMKQQFSLSGKGLSQADLKALSSAKQSQGQSHLGGQGQSRQRQSRIGNGKSSKGSKKASTKQAISASGTGGK